MQQTVVDPEYVAQNYKDLPDDHDITNCEKCYAGGIRPGQGCAWGNHVCCARSNMTHEEQIWKVGALFNALILVYDPQLILMLILH